MKGYIFCFSLSFSDSVFAETCKILTYSSRCLRMVGTRSLFELPMTSASRSDVTSMGEDWCEMSYQCQCGKQFKRNATYQRHLEIAHSAPTSHKCCECGKTFGNANTLTMHMSVHERREAFTRLVKPSTRNTRTSLRAQQEAADDSSSSERSSVRKGPDKCKRHAKEGRDEKETKSAVAYSVGDTQESKPSNRESPGRIPVQKLKTGSVQGLESRGKAVTKDNIPSGNGSGDEQWEPGRASDGEPEGPDEVTGRAVEEEEEEEGEEGDQWAADTCAPQAMTPHGCPGLSPAPLPDEPDGSRQPLPENTNVQIISDANDKCHDARCTQINKRDGHPDTMPISRFESQSENNSISRMIRPAEVNLPDSDSSTITEQFDMDGSMQDMVSDCRRASHIAADIGANNNTSQMNGINEHNTHTRYDYDYTTGLVDVDIPRYDIDDYDREYVIDGDRPLVRKSCRDRKENPIWKTLLTGRMYDEVLDSVDGKAPSAKRLCRAGRELSAQLETLPHVSQSLQSQTPTSIHLADVKQEPREDIFNLDNVKQEQIELGEDLHNFWVPEMVALQNQRLRRGPVRRPRSGSLSSTNGNSRSSPPATFDCFVCGKTFISEKYLSMHISLHEMSKQEQVDVPLNDPGTPTGVQSIDVHSPKAPEDIEAQHQALVPQPEPTVPLPVEQLAAAAHTPRSQAPKTSPSGGGSLNKKASKVQTEGGWTCSLCSKTFAHNSGYKNHMRTHSNERPYVCHICDIGFKEKYHLKKHNLFIHSNELPEKCRVCGKRFKDSTAVRAHERIHSDARPFACRRCNKTFKTSECLWHHEHRSKTCGLALGEIIAQERLIRRRRRFPKTSAHSSPSPTSGSDTNPDTSPRSTEQEMNGQLSVNYTTLQNLQQLNKNDHARLTTTGSFPPANNMNEERSSENVAKHSIIASQLQAIIQPVHPELPPVHQPESRPLQPQVPICVQQHDMSPLPLTNDYRRMSPPNPVAMTMKDLHCLSRQKGQLEDLVLHPHEEEMLSVPPMHPTSIEIKQERDPFGYCIDEDEDNWVTSNMDRIMDKGDDLIDNKVDAILSNMATSMSNAFGVLAGEPLPSPPLLENGDCKENKCRVCQKAFHDTIAFQRHAKVHTEERPFVCIKCDIGFKMKVHLKKHNLYVHSNEYPCECQYCGKKFKDSSAVKLHERTHSDSRPFGCTGCGKAFKTRENLWGHQHRGKCVASKKKPGQECGFDDEPMVKASVMNNGMSAHASIDTNGVTAQAVVSNNQVTARATIENNQITAHATFTNNQFTAHASVINNQVTAHATIINNQVTAQATVSDVKLQNGTFSHSNGFTNPCDRKVVTNLTDCRTMNGSIPSTTTAPLTSLLGGAPPSMAKGLIAQSLMTPPLNKVSPAMAGGNPTRPGHGHHHTTSPTAGTLPVPTVTSGPINGTISRNTAPVQQQPSSDNSSSAAGKWPTLKEFLAKGIGPANALPVPGWCAPQQQQQAQIRSVSQLDNNNGEYKPHNDYPALKERLSRNFFSQLPGVVTVVPGNPTSSINTNVSYPSSPASSGLSAYSGHTTPTAGASPYGRSRDSMSPYSDYSPGTGGPIPSFQSTFLKRTPPPPLSTFGNNNPMLRGDDPSIPIIYWDDDGEPKGPSSAWNSPESDSMFHDISESVFTQL